MTALDKLKAEKARAKAEMKFHEQRISDKLHHLEKNFGKMALQSMLPLNAEQADLAGKFLNPVNTLIDKFLPDAVSDEKKEQLKGVLKTVQLVAAGLAFRFLKKKII